MKGVYHPSQRAIHWAVAAAVFIAIPLGLGIAELSEPEVRKITGGGLGMGDLYWWHKSFGFAVLFLMILRVLAKLRFGAPPYDPPLAKHERIGSAAVHHLLYLGLFALPLTGWIGTSLFGPGVATFFGLTMPDLVSQDRESAGTVLFIHGIVAFGIIGVVGAHIAGAMYHGFVKRDGVVDRMTGGPRD